VAKAQLDSAGDQVNVSKANVDSAEEQLPGPPLFRRSTDHQQVNSQLGGASGHRAKCRDRHHDHFGPEPDGSPRGRRRNGRGGHQARQQARLEVDAVQGSQIFRHGDGCRQLIERQQPDRQQFQQQQSVAGSTSSRCVSDSTTRKLSARDVVSADIETEYRTNVLTVRWPASPPPAQADKKTDPPKTAAPTRRPPGRAQYVVS